MEKEKDSILRFLFRFFDFFVLTFLVFDFGYNINDSLQAPKMYGLVVVTVVMFAFNIIKFRYFRTTARRNIARTNSWILGLLLGLSALVALANIGQPVLAILRTVRPILETGLILYFILRLLILVRYIYEIYYNPAIVFVGSFFALIMLGAFLLMLPTATTHPISFTDALFTSVSAVCVTGLSVLNVSADFTVFGQTIILCLIQIGGLGILTFTSFFAYFFRGSSSFREGLNVRDFTGQENLQDVLKVALQIVAFTLSIEILGAIFMYFSLMNEAVIGNRIFFAIFHSVSAFCNAGFSTVSNGFSEQYLKYHYYFQWIAMFLIILGGLGYNIIYNFYQYIKSHVVELMRGRIHKKVRVITLNASIILYTTVILLGAGFLFFFISEYDRSLADHPTDFGKFTAAAFHSVTPRTAGFNTVDYSQMAVSSLLFVMLLMWIGASPASTGGGIKTSTFALATLNIFSIARGRSRIQILGRRISSESTSRAFAILSISLIVIGAAIMALLIFEPQGTDLMTVAFECFSAYSTVGLTLNFTPLMSEPSKYVIMIVMFIGRIGMLNLMIGMLRQIQHQFYEYPKENILIN